MDRKQFISATAATAALFGLGPNISNQPSSYDLETVSERIINEELLDRFNSLSEESQNKVLSYLDNFALVSTGVGNEALRVLEESVDESVDDTLPIGKYTYHAYQNRMLFNPPTNEMQARQFLAGEPFIFIKAHEYLHALQDTSSSWDLFETFFKSFIPDTSKKGMIQVTLSSENAAIFAETFLGKRVSYDEAKQGFIDMWDEYTAGKPERAIIREMQAYTSFVPYSESSHFRKRLLEKEGNLADSIKAMSSDKFKSVFDTTLALHAIMSVDEAACFVGGHGNSIDNYLEAAVFAYGEDKLKLAYQEGVKRQDSILIDVQRIAIETARAIDHAYES